MAHAPSGMQSSYDRVADEYARRIYGELAHKPLDRELLDRFAAALVGAGPVCDMGCGPGQITGYLRERGLDVFGLDLSAGMLAQARRLNPGIDFRQGDMRALDADAASWAGIAAFYSIIHIPRAHVSQTLREWRRVLRADGRLLLAFHVGDKVEHLDEWWQQKVSVDFYFFEPAEMTADLQAAGFAVEDTILRPPYPDVEAPTQRAYIFARKAQPPE